MENKEYVNPFEDVHKKAKALKDRARETSKKDAELRERRIVQHVEEFRKTGEPD